MSQHLDFEVIAQEVERRAVKEGRALAELFAQYFTDEQKEIDFDRHRIANYTFDRTGTGVLARFPRLIDRDRLELQNRAKMAIKAAFRARVVN